MITAEELLNKYQKEFDENGIVFDLKKPMIEFARLVVVEALSEAYDTMVEYSREGIYPSRRAIINCYPKELII